MNFTATALSVRASGSTPALLRALAGASIKKMPFRWLIGLSPPPFPSFRAPSQGLHQESRFQPAPRQHEYKQGRGSATHPHLREAKQSHTRRGRKAAEHAGHFHAVHALTSGEDRLVCP